MNETKLECSAKVSYGRRKLLKFIRQLIWNTQELIFRRTNLFVMLIHKMTAGKKAVY